MFIRSFCLKVYFSAYANPIAAIAKPVVYIT